MQAAADQVGVGAGSGHNDEAARVPRRAHRHPRLLEAEDRARVAGQAVEVACTRGAQGRRQSGTIGDGEHVVREQQMTADAIVLGRAGFDVPDLRAEIADIEIDAAV